MPVKYHIPIKTTSPRFNPVGKYATVEFREDCAGSCRECVKKKCVYGIFKNNYLHMSTMGEPEYLYACHSCFRCVQECTRGVFFAWIPCTVTVQYRGDWLEMSGGMMMSLVLRDSRTIAGTFPQCLWSGYHDATTFVIRAAIPVMRDSAHSSWVHEL